MKPYGFDGKIAVVVGTITDDLRIYEIPKMTVSITHNLSIFSVPLHQSAFTQDCYAQLYPLFHICFQFTDLCIACN